MPRTQATDNSERQLLDDVATHGWHCLHVAEEEDLPGFSYTIGLYQTCGHPELLIYGLPYDLAHRILSKAAHMALSGQAFDPTKPTNALIKKLPCAFVQVPLSQYHEHLGFATWYYENRLFPAYQIVWPSKTGLFPWQPQAPQPFRKGQPVLGKPEEGLCIL